MTHVNQTSRDGSMWKRASQLSQIDLYGTAVQRFISVEQPRFS